MALQPENLPLIPARTPPVSADDDLAEAEASLLGAADGASGLRTVPRPFGRTPLFDFDRGRFVRAGGSPIFVTGLEALKQRLLMAVYTERFVHPRVFTARFGMENREGPIGQAQDIDDAISDWGTHLVEAWTAIDRVVAVVDVDIQWIPEEAVVFLRNATVVVDDDNDEYRVGPLSIAISEG